MPVNAHAHAGPEYAEADFNSASRDATYERAPQAGSPGNAPLYAVTAGGGARPLQLLRGSAAGTTNTTQQGGGTEVYYESTTDGNREVMYDTVPESMSTGGGGYASVSTAVALHHRQLLSACVSVYFSVCLSACLSVLSWYQNW